MSIFNGESFYVENLNNRLTNITTNQPILLCGEVGTGKFRAAKWIAANKLGAPNNLIGVACADTNELLKHLEPNPDSRGLYFMLNQWDAEALKPLAEKRDLMIGITPAKPVNIAGFQCVYLPPLWQRVIDIPILVNALLKDIGEGQGFAKITVDETLLQNLQRRDWPDNVSGLKATLKQWLQTGQL